MNGEYEVAQKYGNYIDRRNVEYNNATGIIYTPHPFVLTVMTENLGITHEVMWDLAVIMKDYTLGLDEAYAAYEARQSAPAALPPVTEAETPADPGTQGTSQPAADEPVAPAPAVEQPQVEIPTAPAQTPAQDQNDPATARRMVVLILCVAALVILTLAAILKPVLRKKRDRVEEEEETLEY